MGLDRVIEEILTTGEEQRRKILADAAAEKTKTESAARSEVEATLKERQRELEQRTTMMRQQAVSSAELEANKRILKEQNAMLLKTKKEVLRALSELDEKRRKEVLDKLGRIAAKSLSGGVIHCRKEDEKLLAAPKSFKKSADLKSAGGLLAESEDGAFRIDLTFEVLLDDIWGKNMKSVYEMLFGGA